jgi:Immunity protein 42
MEFGDMSRFAVSFELNENSGGPWLFGKFCYWIDNRMIGDYAQGTTLRDVIGALKWIVWDAGKREDCQRFSMPGEDVYRAIDSSLYGHPENAGRESEDATARFDVCPHVDIFNGWKVYLVECEEEARLLYKSSSDRTPREFFLRKGEFDKCIEPAWDALNALYDRAIDSDPS